MSVVGFDFGTQSSRIAVVRGGIDVICNEVSERSTPSMVSFDRRCRYAGAPSKTQMIGNIKNTVVNLPRLAGKLSNDSQVLEIESKYLTNETSEKDGIIAANVTYREKPACFSNIELIGMFFGKLKATTFAETQSSVGDVVISVPNWSSERERRAIIDSAEVAGLHCIRTINDTTAASICYGLTKEFSSEHGKLVAIIDIGYAGTKACIGNFWKDRVDMRSQVSDSNLGGRDFDELLAQHFVSHFKQSSKKVDLSTNTKAMTRLRDGSERIKKMLSGVQFFKLELDNLMNDQDFTLEASRELLEELAQPLLEQLRTLLQKLMKSAFISEVSQISAVEVIGGSSRIPVIKSMLAEFFKREVSTTLNADEAVARGCALQCAMDSPTVRVRDYNVVDVNTNSIECRIGDSVIAKIPIGTPVGIVQKFSLAPPSNFPIKVDAFSCGEQISSFTITPPKAYGKALEMANEIPVLGVKFNLNFLLNISCLLNLKDSVLEVETEEPALPAPEGASEEEVTAAATALPRKITRCHQCHVKSENFRLSKEVLLKLKEAEIAMAIHDQGIRECDDAKNSLEEALYDVRSKLDYEWSELATDAQKEDVRKFLSSTEDWLYDDGADADKATYSKKMGQLNGLIQPFRSKIEAEKKKEEEAAAAIRKAADDARAASQAAAEQKSPISDMDMD